MISLVNDVIDNKDIDQLIEWLKTYPRLTKGTLTEQFEKDWAEYIGTKHAVFVNSGSSANLIALAALIESGKLKKGDEVIVPAVAWATDLAPVVQLGLVPIMCDCNKNTLSLDIHQLQILFKLHNIKAIMLVSVLGLPPYRMLDIKELCDSNKVLIIEDVCESLGSECKGQKLGSFGIMSTYSTYFGHHISTIEGGMVCTNNTEIYNVLKSIRSHGWGRDLDKDFSDNLKETNDVSDFKDQFTFYYLGFNLRSTDLQAFIGINQLKKLPEIVKRRNENYKLYKKLINNSYWKPYVSTENFVSSFAYPIITNYRDELIALLKENDIECRPLIAGNLYNQPFFKEHVTGKELELDFADIVDTKGLYIPNNPSLTKEDIEFVCSVVNKVTTKEYSL